MGVTTAVKERELRQLHKPIDRSADKFKNCAACWNDNQLRRVKRPVQRDMQGSAVVLPRILTVIRPDTAALHRWSQNVDLLSQQPRAPQDLPGLRTGEVHGQRLLAEHYREGIRDISVACLQSRRVRSMPDQVGLPVSRRPSGGTATCDTRETVEAGFLRTS
jgi:hypothetical protein